MAETSAHNDDPQAELEALRQRIATLEHTSAEQQQRLEQYAAENARLQAALSQQTSALRESRGMLWGLLDNASAIIFARDMQGHFILVNQRYCKVVLNRLPEDVIGKTPYELFPAEAARIFLGHDQEVVRGGVPIEREEQVPHYDNEQPRTYLAIKFPLYNERGDIFAVGGISTDISDRKKAEEAMRANQRMLQSILDHSTAVIFVRDLEGRFLLINKRYLSHVLRRSAEEVLGKTLADIYPPETAAMLIQQDQAVIAANAPIEREQEIPQEDGIHTYLAVKFPLYDEQGTLYATGGISTDITQQKRTEQERAALQAQIIEAQRDALRELSTPLMPLSREVLAMPLIGTIDSARAQQVMETLLEGIATHQASSAIIDITGVQVLDTQVANALVQTARAVRLLGAQVILTGIGPAMAQTLVHLGADLGDLVTRSTLQAGIAYALQQAARAHPSPDAPDAPDGKP
jgi:PAS domain S-box-containing protein